MESFIKGYQKRITDDVYLEFLEARVMGLSEDDKREMRLNYHFLIKDFIEMKGKVDLGNEIDPDAIKTEAMSYFSSAFEFADIKISMAGSKSYH